MFINQELPAKSDRLINLPILLIYLGLTHTLRILLYETLRDGALGILAVR
ncbi:hypothetical protein [Nostoc sp.]